MPRPETLDEMYARLKREGMSDRDLAGLQQQLYEERELRGRQERLTRMRLAGEETTMYAVPPPSARPYMPMADPAALSQATRGLTLQELEGQRQKVPAPGMWEYLMRLFGQ